MTPEPEVYCAVHRDGDGDLHYHVVRWRAARLFADLAGSLEPPGLRFVGLFALLRSGFWVYLRGRDLDGADSAMRWLITACPERLFALEWGVRS